MSPSFSCNKISSVIEKTEWKGRVRCHGRCGRLGGDYIPDYETPEPPLHPYYGYPGPYPVDLIFSIHSKDTQAPAVPGVESVLDSTSGNSPGTPPGVDDVISPPSRPVLDLLKCLGGFTLFCTCGFCLFAFDLGCKRVYKILILPELRTHVEPSLSQFQRCLW